MLTGTDPTIEGPPKQEGEVEPLARLVPRLPAGLPPHCSRLVADALKLAASELRRDSEMMMSQYAPIQLSWSHALIPRCYRLTTTVQEGFDAFRKDEENRIARSVLLKPPWTLLRLNGFVSSQLGNCDQGIETHSDRYH